MRSTRPAQPTSDDELDQLNAAYEARHNKKPARPGRDIRDELPGNAMEFADFDDPVGILRESLECRADRHHAVVDLVRRLTSSSIEGVRFYKRPDEDEPDLIWKAWIETSSGPLDVCVTELAWNEKYYQDLINRIRREYQLTERVMAAGGDMANRYVDDESGEAFFVVPAISGFDYVIEVVDEIRGSIADAAQRYFGYSPDPDDPLDTEDSSEFVYGDELARRTAFNKGMEILGSQLGAWQIATDGPWKFSNNKRLHVLARNLRAVDEVDRIIELVSPEKKGLDSKATEIAPCAWSAVWNGAILERFIPTGFTGGERFPSDAVRIGVRALAKSCGVPTGRDLLPYLEDSVGGFAESYLNVVATDNPELAVRFAVDLAGLVLEAAAGKLQESLMSNGLLEATAAINAGPALISIRDVFEFVGRRHQIDWSVAAQGVPEPVDRQEREVEREMMRSFGIEMTP